MKKEWCAVFWGGRPTEDMMFSTAYAADAAWNDTFWKNKRFNELLVAARAELDEKKRRQMYVEMQHTRARRRRRRGSHVCSRSCCGHRQNPAWAAGGQLGTGRFPVRGALVVCLNRRVGLLRRLP